MFVWNSCMVVRSSSSTCLPLCSSASAIECHGKRDLCHLQAADRPNEIKERSDTTIGDKIVDSAVADNMGCFFSGSLEASIVLKVAVDDMHIGAGPYVGFDLGLCSRLVAHDPYDEVVEILRELLQELELYTSVSMMGGIRSVCTYTKAFGNA
jgi:hypothetical protein